MLEKSNFKFILHNFNGKSETINRKSTEKIFLDIRSKIN